MKGEIWRHTHKGKMRCEDESRDEGDAAEAKGHQRLPANHQKLGRGTNRFSLTTLEGTYPANTLILEFWLSEL